MSAERGGRDGGEGINTVTYHPTLTSPDDPVVYEHAHIMDLICEGPIYGLATGDLRSVYLNKVPVQNADMTLNTTDVYFALVNGSNAQPAVVGMAGVESEASLQTKVWYDNPVSGIVSNLLATSCRVKVSVPALYSQSSGTEVKFRIDVNNGSGWVTAVSPDLDGKIKGKFTSKYVKGFKIPLTGSGPWSVRLVRITTNSANANSLQNDLYFESLTTIIDKRLRYPYSAMVAVSINSYNYSSIPPRAYLMKLALIKVPANYTPASYNSTTETWTPAVYATTGAGTNGGVWDGTFKTVWSDNPAWCFYDLATNTRYGAGSYLTAANVDKWSLYTIGQYCDGMVPDGLGGTEPRFRCNCLISDKQDGIKLLNYLASVFRGMVYWASGTVFAIQDVDAAPAAQFTCSDAIDGKFSYQGTARRARHTACLVYWNDPTNYYKRTPEYVEDEDGIARYGLNQVEVTAIGCTSQGQARRLGLWTLMSELTETETVTFDTGLEGIRVRPGEIIQIHDQFRQGTRSGGRIQASTTTSVTLDSPVTIVSGVAYQISCVLPNGTMETRVASNAAGPTSTITVSTAFSAAPQVMGQWLMVSGDGLMTSALYRVVSISESDGIYTVVALLHNPAKYSQIETGLSIIQSGATSFTPFAPVTSLAASESLKSVSEVLSLALLASWDPMPGATDYTAKCSANSGPWADMAVTGSSAEFDGAVLGDYVVRVVAHYPVGISAYKEIAYTVIGSGVLTYGVTNLAMSYSAGQLGISWDLIASTNISYEIRFGSTYASAKILANITSTFFATIADGTYWVTPYYAGSYGATSSVTVAGTTLTQNILVSWDESATGWIGTTTGTASASAAGVTLSSGNSTGNYSVPSAHVVNVGSAQTLTVACSYSTITADSSVMVSSWADVDSVVDVDGGVTPGAGTGGVVIQINTDPGSGTFSGWQNFVPGQYVASQVKMRAVLTSAAANLEPLLQSMTWSVSLPDRVLRGTSVSVPNIGLAVVFGRPFQIVPNLQITIANEQPADVVNFVAGPTKTGFTVQVTNNGAGVNRTINWQASGY